MFPPICIEQSYSLFLTIGENSRKTAGHRPEKTGEIGGEINRRISAQYPKPKGNRGSKGEITIWGWQNDRIFLSDEATP